MLDKNKKAVLDLRRGELGESDDLMEGERPTAEETLANLLRAQKEDIRAEKSEKEEGNGGYIYRERERGTHADEVAKVGGDEAGGEPQPVL